jgi:hypothetical protein
MGVRVEIVVRGSDLVRFVLDRGLCRTLSKLPGAILRLRKSWITSQ